MALAEGQPSIPQEETERICPLGISFIYEFFTTSFGKKVRLVTKVSIVLYIYIFLRSVVEEDSDESCTHPSKSPSSYSMESLEDPIEDDEDIIDGASTAFVSLLMFIKQINKLYVHINIKHVCSNLINLGKTSKGRAIPYPKNLVQTTTINPK